MPGSYTPAPTIILTRTVAALSNMLIGTDAPNAANNTSALKTALDMIASLYGSAALQAVNNTFNGTTLFSGIPTLDNDVPLKNQKVLNTAATSRSPLMDFLVGGANGVRCRVFAVSLLQSGWSTPEECLEITFNAGWNAAGSWFADVTTRPATRYRFRGHNANLATYFGTSGSGMQYDRKTTTSSSWTETTDVYAEWADARLVTANATAGTGVTLTGFNFRNNGDGTSFLEFDGSITTARVTGDVLVTVPASISSIFQLPIWIGYKRVSGAYTPICFSTTVTGPFNVTTLQALNVGDVFAFSGVVPLYMS